MRRFAQRFNRSIYDGIHYSRQSHSSGTISGDVDNTRGDRKSMKPQSVLLAQGVGLFGNLGLGADLRDSPEFYTPISRLCSSPDQSDFHVKQISAGWGHSAVVTTEGQLLVFGRLYDFSTLLQLDRIRKFSSTIARFVASSSNSALFGASSAQPSAYFPDPMAVSIDCDQRVAQVSCSAGLTAALTEVGEVHCFGLNRWLQCGVPIPDQKQNQIHSYTPQRVPLKQRCVALDSGLQHCVALTDEGEVLAWGKSTKGQLGFTEQLPESQCALPVSVQLRSSSGSQSLRAVAVAAGFAHTAAVGEDGAVFVWGKGMAAELKGADKSNQKMIAVAADQLLPRRIELPEGRKATAVCCSNAQVVMIADDNSAWVIGMGEYDRNANPLPLRVQTDYSDNGDQNLVVPEGALLRKGHDRVQLLMPHAGLEGHFSIILHRAEAYVKPLQLQLEQQKSIALATIDASIDRCRIVDFASGWRHSLLLIE